MADAMDAAAGQGDRHTLVEHTPVLQKFHVLAAMAVAVAADAEAAEVGQGVGPCIAFDLDADAAAAAADSVTEVFVVQTLVPQEFAVRAAVVVDVAAAVWQTVAVV